MRKTKIDLLNDPIGELRAELVKATEESLRVELALAVREVPNAEEVFVRVAAALEHLSRTKENIRAIETPETPEMLTAAAAKQRALLAQLRLMLPKTQEGSAVRVSLLKRITDLEVNAKYAGHNPAVAMLARAYDEGLKALSRMMPELQALGVEAEYVEKLFPDMTEYLKEIRDAGANAVQ